MTSIAVLRSAKLKEMPSPDDARLDALTETTVQLLTRLQQVEDRLARLEPPQPLSSFQPPPLPAAPPPIPQAPPQVLEPEPMAMASARPIEPPRSSAPQHLETRMGLTWINRIGVVTLIIGVAFFFKYAIDNQWIGETGRVILGVLAGMITVAAADILWRRGQKTFAQGICGLGVSILYLSFYASFGFYHLLPQAAAFLLMAMTTVMAGALALRYNAMAIAALGMLGGYSTPILLSTGQDAPWTFFSFVFLISLGGVVIARPRRWRPLDVLAFLASALLYLAWFADKFTSEKQVAATVAALAFYALFAVPEWSWIFYASQALAGAALANIWPETIPYLVLSLGLGAAGLVIADLTHRPIAASVSFATFWAAYAFWKSSNGEPERTIAIFLLLSLAFLIYFAWTPFQLLVRRAQIRPQHLTLLALNGAAYFGFSYLLLEPRYKAWLGLFAAAVAGVHLLLGMRLWNKQSAEARDTRPVLLALGIALGFLTLAVPIQFNGFRITMSWALEAAALVWIGRRTNEGRILLGAAAVYALVFSRLYTLDNWFSDPSRTVLLNTRFLTFAVAAASFWLGAWWLKSRRLEAGAAYVIGHFILLTACVSEFFDWSSTAVSSENHASLLAIGVSILLALYAVLLIAIGVAYRSVLDRMLGLGLIGSVVVKLYLYDVWEASRLFRMAAFVALGVLLLLTSYLYSRFRPKIESWWVDENKAGEKRADGEADERTPDETAPPR